MQAYFVAFPSLCLASWSAEASCLWMQGLLCADKRVTGKPGWAGSHWHRDPHQAELGLGLSFLICPLGRLDSSSSGP